MIPGNKIGVLLQEKGDWVMGSPPNHGVGPSAPVEPQGSLHEDVYVVCACEPGCAGEAWLPFISCVPHWIEKWNNGCTGK